MYRLTLDMAEPAVQEPTPPQRFSLPQSLRAAVRSLEPQAERRKDERLRSAPWRKRRLAVALALGGGIASAALAATVLEPAENPAQTTVSGAPRLKLTSKGDFVRWQTSTVELTVDPSFEQLGEGTSELVALAYGTWSSQRGHLPALSVDLSSTSRRAEYDGINLVTYAPITVPGHERSLGVTVAYISGDGVITEVDTIINSQWTFDVIGRSRHHDDHRNDGHRNDDDGHEHDGGRTEHEHGHGRPDCVHAYDLESVLTHEAGHFFGLGEDQENSEATMYYKTGRCETKQRDLSPDDVAAIETVYAEPLAATEDSGGTQAAACAMAPGSRAPGTVGVLLALLGALRVAQRVSERGSRAQGKSKA